MIQNRTLKALGIFPLRQAAEKGLLMLVIEPDSL
jgi:hypothetical protein